MEETTEQHESKDGSDESEKNMNNESVIAEIKSEPSEPDSSANQTKAHDEESPTQNVETTDKSEKVDQTKSEKAEKKDDRKFEKAEKKEPLKSVKTEKKEQPSGNPATKGKNKDEDQKKRAKSAGKKYGFRLTPEEQELAYELKASMMRKMENQNTGLQSELDVRRSMLSLQRQQQQTLYMSRTVIGNGLSQHNLKLLMKAYEKKAKDAEERINQLEQDLEKANDLARRYHDMYIAERSKTSGSGSGTNCDTSSSAQQKEATAPKKSEETSNDPEENTDGGAIGSKEARPAKQQTEGKANKNELGPSQRQNNAEQSSKSPRGNSREKTTEGDLEDDEAIYKRHVVKIVDKKAMSGTSPIRIQDVIRKNEVLITDNEKLRREVERLKWDNKQLLLQVKHSWAHKDKLMHEINTSETARKELTKRLEKEQKQKQTLGRSLSRQAADWIQFRKELQESEEKHRLAMIGPISPSQSAAEERTYVHAAKRNVHMPRNIPVKHWAHANKT